jgi:hypothetical protein
LFEPQTGATWPHEDEHPKHQRPLQRRQLEGVQARERRDHYVPEASSHDRYRQRLIRNNVRLEWETANQLYKLQNELLKTS